MESGGAESLRALKGARCQRIGGNGDHGKTEGAEGAESLRALKE